MSNDRSRPFRLAFATVLTVLGAVVSFAAFAAVFGGGWVGYVFATVVAAVVFVAAFFLYRERVPPVPAAKGHRPGPAQPQRALGPVCDPGPYEVDAGELVDIELDVHEGERIRGHLAELDGQDFDWHLVDERNLVKLRNGEDYTEVRGNERVSADRLTWKVPHDGPWFMVLDLYGRQNPRTVRVSLRRY